MPAFSLAKINLQIGTPKAINVEIRIDENKRLLFIEKLILDFKMDLFFMFPLSMLFDCSLIDGIIVTASEPINVEGIIRRGKVMPIIIPNSDRASVDEYP